jgi:SPP1 family predicted phage head-tail adaptor
MGCIDAGQMRTRAYLQRDAGTQSALTGSITQSWTNVRAIWCKVERLSGRELEQQYQQRAQNVLKVTCRYADDITTGKRLLLPKNSTVLGAAIANGSVTSVTVSDADIVPDARATVIRCESELMIVTAGFGTTTLTVTRGAFGTSGAAHADASGITRYQPVYIDAVLDMDDTRSILALNCIEKEL